jgi:hypothetical protein
MLRIRRTSPVAYEHDFAATGNSLNTRIGNFLNRHKQFAIILNRVQNIDGLTQLRFYAIG